MKVIITGGTGLIGSALAKSLLADGHEVILLTRSPEAQASRAPAGAQLVQWDGKTTQGWGHLVDGSDVIVNLAGESIGGSSFFTMRFTPERKKRILESRVNAGKAVTEAIRAASKRPSVLIQGSAVGYYGNRPKQPVYEDAAAGSDFLAQVLVQSEATTKEVDFMNVRRVVIRTAIVLAKNAEVMKRQMLPFKLFAGGPVGSGKQGYSWIHIDDLIAAIRFLIDNPKAQGAYNLTGPQLVTNAEFGKALARAMHRPYWMPAPAFALKIVFGEAASIILDGQTPDSRKLRDLGFQFKFPELEPALRDVLK